MRACSIGIRIFPTRREVRSPPKRCAPITDGELGGGAVALAHAEGSSFHTGTEVPNPATTKT
jgi:hypothetical protein